MHRAEKSSSRICRNREVERAQELHRKKIDGVKSYLTATILPATQTNTSTRPTTMKPSMSSMFRKFKTPAAASAVATASSSSLFNGDGSSFCSTAAVGDEDEDEEDGTDQQHAGASFFSVHNGDADCDTMHNEGSPMAAHSLTKMDEFRSVVPVTRHTNTKQYGKVPPPPAGAHKKTLNGSFRTRKLKEIQTNNAVIFERIKKSAAHYRNDDLKREWEQNVSYLSSICEFPVAPVLLGNGALRGNVHSLPLPASPISRTPPLKLHEQLPSIHHPAVVHPIRAIPTSPRKLQLNLSPAFRSLRKGMPQQPALPPITAASPGNGGSCSSSDFGFVSPSASSNGPGGGGAQVTSSVTSITGYHFRSNDGADEDREGHLMDSDVPGLPSRETSVASPFIGDLSSPSRITSFADPNFPASSPSSCSLDAEKQKYQLLKLGRFVGGAYLVLTVFCGDGVTNPYGFDVFAFDHESACEFQLRITKEMTHELLDTISSSSQAAVTAAAAGTNLSMEEIAKTICDHVNFSRFESGMGEMAFLMASGVGGATASSSGRKKAALLVDSMATSIAFCIHQVVEIGVAVDDEEIKLDADELIDNGGEGAGRKCRLHVFASTRPQKSALFVYDEASSIHTSGDESSLIICFQMCESPPSYTATTSPEFELEVDISVDELCEIVSRHSGDKTLNKHRTGGLRPPANLLKECVSIERVIVAAIRHLHIVSVPSGEESEGNESEVLLKQVLIVNQHVNTLLNPVGSVASSKGLLEKWKSNRSRHRLPRAPSLTRAQAVTNQPTLLDSSTLLETGVVWKSAYVLARVSIIAEESSGGGNSAIHKRPQNIQDLEEALRFSVYNPLSASYSECTFSPEQLGCLVDKLDKLLLIDGGDRTDFEETTAFIRHVVTRLQIEVDLFGIEVLTFPSLDVRQPLNSHTSELLHRSGSSAFCSSRSSLHGTTAVAMVAGTGTARRSPGRQSSGPQKDHEAATLIQAQVRGFLFRKQYYYEEEEENGGSGEEEDGESDDGGHDGGDGHDEETDLHTEMSFQSDGECSRQQSRHGGGGGDQATSIESDGGGEKSTDQVAEPEVAEEPQDDADDQVEADYRALVSTSVALTEAAATFVRKGVKMDNCYCLVKARFAGGDNIVRKQIVFRLGDLGRLALFDEEE